MPDVDPGLFGPESVTWHMYGDPMMWVGGVRALYLQALHPRAVHGLLQNSDLNRDPWGRLLRTADFVGTITYGSTREAERRAARVRAIHRRLSAVDPGTGTRFSVDDPELLRWVHCAEIDSYLAITRRSVFPLSPAQANVYVDEQRTAARLIGLDPARVPGDLDQLAGYFAQVLPRLTATPELARIHEFLTNPPMPALFGPVRTLLWRRAARLAYSALPSLAHLRYGLPALPEQATTQGLRTMGAALRAIPPFVRWQIPPGRIRAAVGRLGPGSHPSAWRLAQQAKPGHNRRSSPGSTGGAHPEVLRSSPGVPEGLYKTKLGCADGE